MKEKIRTKTVNASQTYLVKIKGVGITPFAFRIQNGKINVYEINEDYPINVVNPERARKEEI